MFPILSAIRLLLAKAKIQKMNEHSVNYSRDVLKAESGLVRVVNGLAIAGALTWAGVAGYWLYQHIPDHVEIDFASGADPVWKTPVLWDDGAKNQPRDLIVRESLYEKQSYARTLSRKGKEDFVYVDEGTVIVQSRDYLGPVYDVLEGQESAYQLKFNGVIYGVYAKLTTGTAYERIGRALVPFVVSENRPVYVPVVNLVPLTNRTQFAVSNRE